jgi:ubiquitin C-terminal hydrolase
MIAYSSRTGHRNNNFCCSRCLSCKQDATKQDEHSYLLPVFLMPRSTTVAEGLAHAMKEEKMEGENQYACQKCQRKTDALISHRITKLPKFLVLQVMRFEFNKYVF